MPIGFGQKTPFMAMKRCKQSLCVLLVVARCVSVVATCALSGCHALGSDSSAQL